MNSTDIAVPHSFQRFISHVVSLPVKKKKIAGGVFAHHSLPLPRSHWLSGLIYCEWQGQAAATRVLRLTSSEAFISAAATAREHESGTAEVRNSCSVSMRPLVLSCCVGRGNRRWKVATRQQGSVDVTVQFSSGRLGLSLTDPLYPGCWWAGIC